MAEEFEKEVEKQVGKRIDPKNCEEIEEKIKNFLSESNLEEYGIDAWEELIVQVLVAQGYNEKDVLECIKKIFDEMKKDNAKEKLDQIKKIVNNLKL